MLSSSENAGKLKNNNKYSRTQKKEHVQGVLFITPAVIVVAIFIAISVLFVLYISFHRVNLIKGTYEFVGLQNYRHIFQDDLAKTALINTVKFSFIVVPLQTFIAIVLASVLSSNIRGKKVFRVLIFLPALTSSAALTMIFMFIFNLHGPVNDVLIRFGLLKEGINYLYSPRYALYVIMGMNIWSTVPMYMTFYIAALQDLPKSMYEAAAIDGANEWQKFFKITVPYLRPITVFVLLTGIIGTLQMFDQAYIFSDGSGGPANSTLTIALLVYRYAFGSQNAMGYAATISVLLALLILGISLIVNRLNKEERVY